MLYGGGCNMHRAPYGGRNFEYYSEDSTIAFYSGDAQGTAMRRGGLISMFKHFCGNDQETNRHGVATFMSEQVVRQNETRSFEGALHTGSAMSNMSAYNRLGAISTASYKSLLTTVLREEWGATGISITDSSKDAASYIFTADAIDAGTDMFNNDADRATEVKALLIKNRDGHIWKQARVSAKRFFYNMVNSNLAYGMDESTEVKSEEPWWKGALIAINVVLGVLAVAGVGLYVVFTFVIKPKGE
jgi:beta-glucosidase